CRRRRARLAVPPAPAAPLQSRHGPGPGRDGRFPLFPGLEPLMRLIALCGSTRRHSLNARLLDAASACAPPGLQIVHASPLATLPHLDEDTEEDAWREGPVAELARAVRASDGLLIATPEYNQSIPGVLKNALDWLSRHPQPGLLEGRRAALMGATVGPWGTRLA